jgi:hypothetical protein
MPRYEDLEESTVLSLPPGTDTYAQLRESPRLPLPPPKPWRKVPELPPMSERKGKWVVKYLNTLDPDTEFDQIVRIYTFYNLQEIGAALVYAVLFPILTQTQGGAAAIHTGGKVYRRGHARFYDTLGSTLVWVSNGSTSPETIKEINNLNKLHYSIWERTGKKAATMPWTFQMAPIASNGVMESYIRNLVGAKDLPEVVRKAYPKWCEQICSHFTTEKGDGFRNVGMNFPRNWQEYYGFLEWHDNQALDSQMTERTRSDAHFVNTAFLDQFAELYTPWWPYLGRQAVTVFVPPNCRRAQGLGDPNRLLEAIIRFFVWLIFTIADWQDDPTVAPGEEFMEKCETMKKSAIDAEVKRQAQKAKRFVFVAQSSLLGVGAGLILIRYFGLSLRV